MILLFILFFSILSHLEQLPGDPLIVHLNLTDHVTRDVSGSSPTFAPIEPISVLFPDNLNTI